MEIRDYPKAVNNKLHVKTAAALDMDHVRREEGM